MRSLVSILGLSFVCCSVIVLGFRLANSLLPLGNLAWLAIQIPSLFGLLYVMSWVYRAVPEQISVFEDCLLIQHGNTSVRIKASNIISARVVVFAHEKIRLRIFFLSQERRKSKTYGLDTQTELGALEQSLGCELVVWDARKKWRQRMGAE